MWFLLIPAALAGVYVYLRSTPPSCQSPIISSKVNLHTHSICLIPGKPHYQTTRDFGHTHTVDFDASQIANISAGSLPVESSVDAGHSHTFVVTLADWIKIGLPTDNQFAGDDKTGFNNSGVTSRWS